jgi:UDP-N-acetylmuramate dehydrogenase
MAMNAALKQQLQNKFSDRVRFDEPMSEHTSLKIGGPADAYVMPADENELVYLVKWINETGLRFFMLGWGTNLLVKDKGFRGIVIATSPYLNNISMTGPAQISAMAGTRLKALCRYATEKGLSGMNFALGIPGTVGGAILMNAGTSLGTISNALDRIRIIRPGGNVENLDKSSLDFSYRGLTFPVGHNGDENPPVIIEGNFSFSQSSSAEIKAEGEIVLKNRFKTQPKGLASAGCFFKNPDTGESAGQLIDQAGLKGIHVGDASVSEKHANFIYNRNSATAEDVLRLAEIVKETIFKKFNITLETEVKIIGE